MVRIFGYYLSKAYLILALWEAVIFSTSLVLGNMLRFQSTLPVPTAEGDSVAITAALFTVVMSSAMTAMGLYLRGVQEHAARFIVRLAVAFALGTTAMALVFYAFPATFMGRGVLAFSLVAAFVGVLSTRAMFIRIATAKLLKRRVLVLGTGVNAQEIEEAFKKIPEEGFTVVGYVPLGERNELIEESRQLSNESGLLDLVVHLEVDEIVVAMDDKRRKLPVAEILDCKMSGIEVMDLLTFFEKEYACINIDSLHPSWIFFSNGFRLSAGTSNGKRIFDFLVSLLMLVVFSPVMMLVAIASLIESRGKDPILYNQVRVGQHGNMFRLHKFRSMRVDAEADGVIRWASANDARVTRLGVFLRKTRLDELPQIFNVLWGQMSLVGPRPERPEFVERLSRTIHFYAERHRVKPGLTGWAQVLYPYGANEEDAKRKLEYDLYYVKNAGIMLDLVILLQTAEVVLFGKGAR